MPAPLARIIGFAFIAVSVAALTVSLIAMVGRLADRNDLKNQSIVWFMEPIVDPVFEFLGTECAVSVVDAPPPDGSAGEADPFLHAFPWDGAARHIRVSWRGHTIALPIVGDDQPAFPGLMRFDDWLRVVPMAVATASNNREVASMLQDGRLAPRLIIAARYPAEGFDPESWGLVRRQDWPYAFVELLVDGPAESAVRIDRATYRQLEDAIAPGPYAKPVELTPEQLADRQWQHAAMLQVTPSVLYRARDKQVQAGMRAMGWTWPVAGVSAIGAIVGLGLVVMSGVRRS